MKLQLPVFCLRYDSRSLQPRIFYFLTLLHVFPNAAENILFLTLLEKKKKCLYEYAKSGSWLQLSITLRDQFA